MPASQHIAQPRNTEQLIFGVGGFGNPVAEQDQGVTRFQCDGRSLVFRGGDEPDRKRAFRERFGKLLTA